MTMRPIDAEALEEKIENLITRFKPLGKKQVAEDYNFVLTVLSTAPTIEAKPVVHARWEEVREGRHICSNCKVKASLTSDEYDYMEDLSDYCPYCGAQMDEGVKIPVISMEDVPKLAKEMEK